MSDCVKPSVEEIKKWLKETYGPEWENKVELGYKLWEKKHCRKKKYSGTISGSSEREYKKVHIEEIGDKQLVEITGIVIDRENFVYLGCPICFKSVNRGCVHLNNGTEPVSLTISKVVISDGTGDLTVTTLLKPEDEDPFDGINEGDMITVKGYSRIVDGEKRLYLNDVEIVQKVENGNTEENVAEPEHNDNILRIDDINNPNAQAFLRYLANSGGMNKELAMVMIEKKGVMWDEIKDYVEIDGDLIKVKEGVI